MTDRTQEIIAECRRQEDSCLYTSVSLFEWLKSLRWWRIWFVILPIVAGSVAALLTEAPDWKWLAAVSSLVAGVTTAVYKALDLDVSVDAISKTAHEFKVLQDRFRQAARITALGDPADLEKRFSELMDRMDAVRSTSLTAPDRFFKKAQSKIQGGDYTFDVDQRPPA
jgi:hypothetical protein